MKKLFSAIASFFWSVAETAHALLFDWMAGQGLILTVVTLPNGTVLAIASGYGASKAMSAVSNANPGVATLAASHGVIVGDVMEVTSGWSRLTNRIVRASVVATNDVSLEGINTTSTTVYPAGAGTGSIREITGWTNLSQILESNSDGGEQQFFAYQFLEADSQTRIPTVKSPFGLSLKVADDPLLAGQILAAEANDDRLQRAVRATLANGSLIFYNAYISANKTPSLTVNEAMAIPISLSLLSDPVRYAS